MKKILILNGSPKRNMSSTLHVAKAFAKGIMETGDYELEIINVSDLNIKPCTGCLSCWSRTEGECVIKNDDIPMLKKKILECDIFIEAFPLFYFGMPGTLKVLTDRMLSMMNTYRGQESPKLGESFHGLRYKNDNQKFVVISSCAYTEAGPVYESLKLQFDCICGNGNYLFLTSPQLKTLIELKNETKINRYLAKFEKAGSEFGVSGTLTQETMDDLKKPPFTLAGYKVFLDNFWKQEKEKGTKE